MSGEEIVQCLKAAGRIVMRIKGSHRMVCKDGQMCPVSLHGTLDIASGTLAKITQINGLKFSKEQRNCR